MSEIDTERWTEILTQQAEAAESAMLEAGHAWLVIQRRALPFEFYGEQVYVLLDQFYPGGAAAFRANPVAAVSVQE